MVPPSPKVILIIWDLEKRKEEREWWLVALGGEGKVLIPQGRETLLPSLRGMVELKLK